MFTHNIISKSVKIALIGHFVVGAYALPAYAQEQENTQPVERIAVTGSRLKRAEFSEAAPVQVLDIDTAVKSGVTTVAELLSRTSVANGQQFDATFNSNSGNSNASEPPPSGGVGSANIGLRGLGPERTLILINGKRLGSSGVRGAPSQPDLSLLPLNAVERIEVITEGASSIYGADAVAGVINVILKDSSDGAEISANISVPEDDGGETKQISFLTGFEGEKASFVFSMNYFERERIAVGDRADCLSLIARDEQGNIFDGCRSRFFDNVILDVSDNGINPLDIFSFYTPGQTDIGIPNFSSALGLPVPPIPFVDILGNTQRARYTYSPLHNDNIDRLQADLVQPVTRFTIVANGDYKPDWWGGNEEIFYETYFFHRHLTNRASNEQIFPTIPALIPQEDANGNLLVNQDGSLQLFDNPLSPFPNNVSNIVTLEDVPQERDVELNHVRVVGGLRGDFTGQWAQDNYWSYEIFASYDRGVGDQTQPVINETNLSLALGTLRLDNEGNAICGIGAGPNDIGFITPNPCVPINFFAPSIFTGGSFGGGTFATDAERDFLIATRINTTTVEQTLISAVANGDLFEFGSGGTAATAFGLEYRRDRIQSEAEVLGSSALIAAENPLTEGATNGARDVTDVFAEISLPFLVDRDWAKLLELQAALRYTDESNFGSEVTQRFRLTWEPSDQWLLSASFGTSFRAPNLREQFLADQFGGTSGGSDPCAVPEEVLNDGVYDPSRETRSQTVLDNCTAQGADFTLIGTSGVPTIPVRVGGNAAELRPETSDNITASIKWSPELGDYKLDLGVTYFSLEIEDTIRSIDPATILTRCFNDAPNLESPFCPRVIRDGSRAPAFNFPNSVDASFINIGEETSKGVDFNSLLASNFEAFDATFNWEWAVQYTLQTERELTIFDGEPAEDLLDDFGTPEHRLTSTLNVKFGDWQWLTVFRAFSGTGANDVTRINSLCDVFTENDEIGGTPTQPICDAGGIAYWDTSVSYIQNNYDVTLGINNIFDRDPPRVNGTAGSNRANRVTSSGYDQLGRTIFLNATYRF
jgi:iron complex outermembrane receptor protein